MKKLFVILACVATLGFAACNNGGEGHDGANDTTAVEESNNAAPIDTTTPPAADTTTSTEVDTTKK